MEIQRLKYNKKRKNLNYFWKIQTKLNYENKHQHRNDGYDKRTISIFSHHRIVWLFLQYCSMDILCIFILFELNDTGVPMFYLNFRDSKLIYSEVTRSSIFQLLFFCFLTSFVITVSLPTQYSSIFFFF